MNKLQKNFKDDLTNKTNVDFKIDTSRLDFTSTPTKKSKTKLFLKLAIVTIIIALVIILLPPTIFFIASIHTNTSFKETRKSFKISELKQLENDSFMPLNEITYPTNDLKNLAIDSDFKDNYQDFAYNVYNNLDSKTDTFYSPISLYSLLVSCLLSTNDEITKNQLLDLMRINNVQTSLENYLKMYQNNYFANDNGTIQMYNAAFFTNKYSLNKTYLNTLDDYYIEAFKLDFTSEKDFNKMLSWIDLRLQTHNFTNKNELGLKDDLAFYLFNTFYFNNKWQHNFSNSMTYKDSFYNEDGQINDVSFMTHRYFGKLYDYDSYVSCYDYYKNGQKIQYLVPKDLNSNINTLLNDINFLKEDESKQIKPTEGQLIIDLSVPKFDRTNLIDLTNTLNKLGLTRMFNYDSYAFNNIFKNVDDSIYLKFIKQKNQITIDEDGTTIKSLSMGYGKNESAGENIRNLYEIKLNQPFIYVIYDQKDLPLFMGQVSNF